MRDIRKTLYLATGLGVKLVTGLVAVKMCAHYLGPEQFGLTGQVSSLIAIVSLLAGAGVNVGLTKIYADKTFPLNERASWISASGWLVLVISLLLGITFYLASETIKAELFPDYEAAHWVILMLIVSILPVGFSAISQGKINGSHRDDLYSFSLVIGSLIGIFGLWILGNLFAELGALLGMVWLVASQGIAMFYLGRRIDRIPLRLMSEPKKLLPRVRFLLGYGALSIAAGVVIPLTYILIRILIQEYNSSTVFGLWQATLRISEAYSQLPLLLLSVVMFSRFAASSDQPLQRMVVIRTYGFIALLMLIISAVVYFSRYQWIPLVFTDSFLPMESFVIWQLIGDGLRVMSYVATTIMAARGAVKLCIFGEFFQGFLLLSMSFIFVPAIPVYGQFYAFICTYFVYALITFCLLVIKFGNSHAVIDR